MPFFDILAPILGYIMEFIITMVPLYGVSLIIFTVLTKLIMVPLSIKQQKSTARMSAFQKPMKELQEKYKDDKQKMNEELMKFQKENGVSMTAGCLPLIVNMFVIFGLIEVLYYPLQHIFHQSVESINAAAVSAGLGTIDTNGKFAPVDGLQVNILESRLLAQVNENPAAFEDFFGEAVTQMATLEFSFLGLDLTALPAFNQPLTLILPIFTVISMVAIQLITPKMTGQEMPGSMKYMPWMMAVMFGWFCFTVPVAFSLYYTISNILMFGQSFVLRKLYDPQKIKAQVEQQIEEQRKERKKKKQVVLKDEKGKEVIKEVSQSEHEKLRLEKARQLDLERYGE